LLNLGLIYVLKSAFGIAHNVSQLCPKVLGLPQIT